MGGRRSRLTLLQGSGSPGRNVLLIERIHELEEQLQELRDGAPFVEEATVRSFLTQIDLAYTEDLEMQAKVRLSLLLCGCAPRECMVCTCAHTCVCSLPRFPCRCCGNS